jgi:hypothetical protein
VIYELTAGEQELLGQACRTADLIARMEAEQAGQPLTVPGSRGQVTAHPLLASIAQHRAILARLLDGLDLPDDAGQAVSLRRARSQMGRQAARARWSG